MDNSSTNGTTTETSCSADSQKGGYFTSFCLCVLVVLFLSKLAHTGLSRIGQPRIISEFAVSPPSLFQIKLVGLISQCTWLTVEACRSDVCLGSYRFSKC